MDRILLFKRNLEKVSGTREELVEQIEITVKHEIGHCLGLDEDRSNGSGLAESDPRNPQLIRRLRRISGVTEVLTGPSSCSPTNPTG